MRSLGEPVSRGDSATVESATTSSLAVLLAFSRSGGATSTGNKNQDQKKNSKHMKVKRAQHKGGRKMREENRSAPLADRRITVNPSRTKRPGAQPSRHAPPVLAPCLAPPECSRRPRRCLISAPCKAETSSEKQKTTRVAFPVIVFLKRRKFLGGEGADRSPRFDGLTYFDLWYEKAITR